MVTRFCTVKVVECCGCCDSDWVLVGMGGLSCGGSDGDGVGGWVCWLTVDGWGLILHS